MENDETMYWRWGVGIVVAIVVIIGAVMLIKGSRSSPQMGSETGTSTADTMTENTTAGSEIAGVTATPSSATETAQPSMIASGESVMVADQAEGSSVDVSAMSLSKPSWIAIKDAKGWILGAGWFPAGATSGSVPLIRNTQTGSKYEAVIYVDDGDKAFDFHKDMLVTNADGMPVDAMFMAK